MNQRELMVPGQGKNLNPVRKKTRTCAWACSEVVLAIKKIIKKKQDGIIHF